MRLVRTCPGCPEQYDVYKKGELVGYLRLRHGFFEARFGGVTGPSVYRSYTDGDGAFTDEERNHHLKKAKKAIKRAWKKREQGGPSDY